MQQWRRLMLRHFRHGGPELLDYAGDPRGHRPLREAIASYLSRARAVECESDQVLITNGTQQASLSSLGYWLRRGRRLPWKIPDI